MTEEIDGILWELAEGEITTLETKQKLSELGVMIQSEEVIFYHGYFPKMESLLEEK